MYLLYVCVKQFKDSTLLLLLQPRCVWGNPITQNVVRVEPKKAQGKASCSLRAAAAAASYRQPQPANL